MPEEPLPLLHFKSQAAWAAWLAKNHANSRGVRLQFARVGSGKKSLNHAEALEVALCYGWIDGLAKRIDDFFWGQKFGPRTRQSLWSKINREKAIALIECGLMQPAGQKAIKEAQANGRWDAAYEGARSATVPPDLQAALERHPKAAEFFAKLDRLNRYAFLFRLQTALKPETRAARLQKFVAMLERGERLHDKEKRAAVKLPDAAPSKADRARGEARQVEDAGAPVKRRKGTQPPTKTRRSAKKNG